MSVVDDTDTHDDRTDREILEERFGERRHVLKRIAELDTALSEDAQEILTILDEDGGQS